MFPHSKPNPINDPMEDFEDPYEQEGDIGLRSRAALLSGSRKESIFRSSIHEGYTALTGARGEETPTFRSPVLRASSAGPEMYRGSVGGSFADGGFRSSMEGGGVGRGSFSLEVKKIPSGIPEHSVWVPEGESHSKLRKRTGSGWESVHSYGGDMDGGVGPKYIFAFLVNATLCVGFNSLPFAFSKSGLALGTLLFCILVGFSWMGALWIVTAISNYHAICRHVVREKYAHTHTPQTAHSDRVSISTSDFEISNHACHIDTILKSLGTVTAKRCYAVVFALMSIGSLWSYAAIFGASFAAKIEVLYPLRVLYGYATGEGIPDMHTCDLYGEGPLTWECYATYWQALALFACMVVPLSLCDLKEQGWFHFLMASIRFVLIGGIVGASVYMAATGQAPPHPENDIYDPHKFPPHSKMADWMQIRPLLTATAFAMSIHGNIPDCIQFLADKPQHLTTTVQAATGTSSLVFLVIGLTVPLAFGRWTLPVCSLNFQHYTAGYLTGSVPHWVGAFVQFIIFAPTVDVISAFPINAIVLGDNVNTMLHGRKGTPRQKLMYRLLVAFGPIFGAAALFNIDNILEWTGVPSFFLVFMMPPALWYITHREAVKRFGLETVKAAPFYGCHCSPLLCVLSVCVCVLSASWVFAANVMKFILGWDFVA